MEEENEKLLGNNHDINKNQEIIDSSDEEDELLDEDEAEAEAEDDNDHEHSRGSWDDEKEKSSETEDIQRCANVISSESDLNLLEKSENEEEIEEEKKQSVNKDKNKSETISLITIKDNQSIDGEKIQTQKSEEKLEKTNIEETNDNLQPVEERSYWSSVFGENLVISEDEVIDVLMDEKPITRLDPPLNRNDSWPVLNKYVQCICFEIPWLKKAHRALELLEDYHSRLSEPQDRALRIAIERVIRIFKSRLFQALLDIQEFYELTLLDDSKTVQQKTAETLQIASKWEQEGHAIKLSDQNQRFKVEGETELPKTDGHYQQSPAQRHSPEPTANKVQQAPVESHHSEQAVSEENPPKL